VKLAGIADMLASRSDDMTWLVFVIGAELGASLNPREVNIAPLSRCLWRVLLGRIALRLPMIIEKQT